MERSDILSIMQDVFKDVFDNNNLLITEDTVAEDIEEWDSLAHIQLIKEIEARFNIKLTSKEFMSWDNIGEMIDSIQSKIA